MSDVWFKAFGLPVYWLSAFVVLAFLWFGFVVYKKGQEYHYHEESLLDLIVLSGVLAWLFGRLVFVLFNWSMFSGNWVRLILLNTYPGYHLLGVILGIVVANILMSRREEIKLFEGLDLLALGLAGAIPFERLGRVFTVEVTMLWQIPVELIEALFFLVLFIWLWKAEREYRTYKWYRYRQTTAKPGFIAAVTMIVLGLVLGGHAVLPSLAMGNLIFGIVLTLTGLLTIFIRSGRRFSWPSFRLPKK